MRYYFAGAYQRRAELLACSGRLHAASIGAIVVSRWLTQDQTGEGAGFTSAGLTDAGSVARAWSYAARDFEDLSVAQVVVSFTGEGARGGRHVEYGFAIAQLIKFPWVSLDEPLRLAVIGPREHVFHCHPAVEVYPGFDAFLAHEIEVSKS